MATEVACKSIHQAGTFKKKKKYNTEASLGLKDLQILSQNTTFHNVQTLVLHFSVQLHLSNQVLGTYRLSLCS